MTNKFVNTYSGKKLLEKHSLSTEGTWAVYGEDPNCDLGGPHHQPLLGYYTGKLIDVIANVESMNSFWQWGAGGRIELVSAVKVVDAEATRIARAREALELAKAEVERLEKELCPQCIPGGVCKTPICKRLSK